MARLARNEVLPLPVPLRAALAAAYAAEYRGQVPGWLFKLNRRRFLKALLARERIFLSDWFHERYDGQACTNLRRAVTEKR